MSLSSYIETSVVSYLTARLSKNVVIAAHQVLTQDFWSKIHRYNAYISDIVIREVTQGDPVQAKKRLETIEKLPALGIDDDVKELARLFLQYKAIPNKYPEDALHIAIAAKNGMDAIITWNFKHINNACVRKLIRESLFRHGYLCPEICSPEEFLGGGT